MSANTCTAFRVIAIDAEAGLYEIFGYGPPGDDVGRGFASTGSRFTDLRGGRLYVLRATLVPDDGHHATAAGKPIPGREGWVELRGSAEG